MCVTFKLSPELRALGVITFCNNKDHTVIAVLCATHFVVHTKFVYH